MATARWIFFLGLVCALVFAPAFGVLGADEAKPAAVAVPSSATPYGPSGSTTVEIKSFSAAPVAVEATPPGTAAHDKPGEMPAKGETPGQAAGKPDDAKTKELIKPIHRPAAPATPPNPNEFKVRPNSAGKIRLSFNGQSWQPVLEWLATISGMSLDWQELPGDCINLSTQQSYTVPEVRDLINRLLLARGYTLLCRGEVLTVAEIKKIDPSLVPRVDPADLSKRDPHEFVKVSFPLVSLMADTAAEELKPMLSPNGRLTPLPETNRLEVMDAVTNLRDIDAILKEQRADDNPPRSFREFKLKHARADEVHRLLATLLGMESPKSPMAVEQQGNMNPEQQQQQAMMMARMQAGNQPGQQPPGGAPPKAKAGAINMAVNERNNSIFVQARPDKMTVIAQVIEAIDIPVNHDDSLLVNLNRMQVYRLAGVEPDPVVKTLMEIGNLEPGTRLEVDRKNSAIIAYASLADHVTIRAVVDKLAGSERKFEVIHLRRLAADYVAGTIDFMMGSGAKKEKSRSSPYFNPFDQGRQVAENTKEFRVDADIEHNRLLLWANPVELTSVEALLAKLGEIPASGSGSAGIRVIDSGDAKETEELLERIRRAWPSIAPNALLAPAATAPLEESKGPARPLPALPKDSSTSSPLPSPSPGPAVAQTQAAVFHLAVMRGESADSTPADNVPAGKAPTDSVPTERAAEERPRDSARPAPPPVKITIGPDGKLILSSEDGQALDRLEELAAQLATARKDYRVYRLKYAWAVGVALNLEDFFKEDKKERPRSPFPYYFGDVNSQDDSQDDRRLSKRRKLRFISDTETNTILVEGASAEQLRTIEDLIQLYDQPPPTDTQSVRKTEIIRLKYSKAKAVADTVKDVYRDLLSANDKALADNQRRDSGRSFVFNYSDTDKTEQKTPKFKGLLSIGIDEVSNSLMVSAPGYLFDHVTKMIKELDAAAAPDYTVRMVRVNRGMSAQQMKGILDEVFMQKPREKPTGEERPAAKPSRPAARNPGGAPSTGGKENR